jgi:hypothetical protein
MTCRVGGELNALFESAHTQAVDSGILVKSLVSWRKLRFDVDDPILAFPSEGKGFYAPWSCERQPQEAGWIRLTEHVDSQWVSVSFFWWTIFQAQVTEDAFFGVDLNYAAVGGEEAATVRFQMHPELDSLAR